MKREELINKVLDFEWEMFTNVNGADGRATCQDDKKTFMIMRKAQADIWSADTLNSYFNDLKVAKQNNANLMTLKYARMMEMTFPEEYEAIKKQLPVISVRVSDLVCEIVKHHLKWSMEASQKYPKLFSLGRPVTGTVDRSISIENYLRSELLTYSENTLNLCLKDTIEAAGNDINLSLEILKNTAGSYGFDALDAIEEKSSGGK